MRPGGKINYAPLRHKRNMNKFPALIQTASKLSNLKHLHYKTVLCMRPSLPTPKPTATNNSTKALIEPNPYKMERQDLSAKTLDSSQELLRSWTSDIKMVESKIKCNRDPIKILLLITEAKCYKTKTRLKAC